VSMLPALAVVLHSNRDYHQWWQQTTADRRWTQYYDTMLTRIVRLLLNSGYLTWGLFPVVLSNVAPTTG